MMFIMVLARLCLEKEDLDKKQSVAAYVASVIDDRHDAASRGYWKTYCGAHAMKSRNEILGKPVRERQSPQHENDYSNTELEGPDYSNPHALSNFIGEVMAKFGKPDYVIVFRDGVSHEELDDVYLYEIGNVKAKFPDLPLIWLVVQKQNSTKFLVDDEKGDINNPPAGAVFANAAKHIKKQKNGQDRILDDFFLISTVNDMSTCKPVHYIFLEGTKHLPVIDVQRLTFAACHLYPNWFSSIRVPYVVQTAHKLAKLLGENCEEVHIHEKLRETFFYL